MLFLYFNGIRSEQGEYVVEVSHTADGERRIMNVPAVFFMKVPVNLLTATLDTRGNHSLNAKMDAQPDVRFVKSMRRNFGQKLLSSEPVTLDTNWNVMIDRNILVRCLTIDKDNIERNVTAGAKYETISNICPLSSHLVGFATKLGEPAMIFMTAQAKSAQRPDDKANDSMWVLYNESRKKYYELDVLLNPAILDNNKEEIETISKKIRAVAEIISNVEQEEKTPVISSSHIFTELQKTRIINDINMEKELAAEVNHAESLLSGMQTNVDKANALLNEIYKNVSSIHSWVKEKNKKNNNSEEKMPAAASLIKAGEKSARSDVVNAGLPIEGTLGDVMRTGIELQRDMQAINAASQAISSTQVVPPPPTSSAPVSVPSAPTSAATEIESKTPASIPAEQPSGGQTETAEESKAVPAQAAGTITSPTTQQTPAQAQQPTLAARLQKLAQQAEAVLAKAINLNTIAQRNFIKHEAANEIASLGEIIAAEKSARAQRNKEIVNWPAARDLIAESNSGLSQGYTRWTWYYTNFPKLFVNYLFEVFIESGRWGDVVFNVSNTISHNPLTIYSVPYLQDAMNTYERILTKIATKALGRDPGNELPKGIFTPFIFGQSNGEDKLQRLCNPRPARSYKSDEAGRAELAMVERQTNKLSELVTISNKQLEETKQKFQLTVAMLDKANQLPNSEENTKYIMSLREKLSSLDILKSRLQASTKKAAETYTIAMDFLNEKRNRNAHLLEPEQKAMDVEEIPEEEKWETPVRLNADERKREEAAAKEKQLMIAKGLITALTLNKKDRFLELYPQADALALAKVIETFGNKTVYLNKFNSWIGEQIAELSGNTKRLKK